MKTAPIVLIGFFQLSALAQSKDEVTIERMAKEVCELVGTNLTAEEWSAIVPDILYEPACPD